MILKRKQTKEVSLPTTSTPRKTPERTISYPSSIIYNREDMRDLFFIVKGQYQKGVEPSFTNSVTGETSYVGGFDPNREDTEEWYMVLDKVTFNCIACGSDLKKVAHSVYTIITKFKGKAKKYFKYVSEITSDDYYETHYLGHAPLTHDQLVKKAEGRCPRVSPVMRCLYSAIYSEYGYYYVDLVDEMEDLAYHDLEEWNRENKPINKTKKRLARTKVQKPVMETPKDTKVITPSKVVKPKVKLGVKKLSTK